MSNYIKNAYVLLTKLFAHSKLKYNCINHARTLILNKFHTFATFRIENRH